VSTLAWVVGRGGLLGSSVERALGPGAWRPHRPLAWSSREKLAPSVEDAVRGFADRLGARAGESWSVYWCAGAGVVGTSAADLEFETAALRLFLDRLGAEPRLEDLRGRIFLASSAGGVYAGSAGRPLTEDTPPRPISDYGRAKLAQEETLVAWARGRPRVSTLVGRLANLYGPGQRLDKPQGLISHMSRCLIFGVPVHVYVPLDTIRDYLYAADAGRRVVAGLERLAREGPGGRHATKIYASERETSVAGLIGVFRRLAKRQLRVVSGLHPVGTQQPARLQFRSTFWRDEAVSARTQLLEGVGRVHRHQLALFQAGRLEAPPLPSPR
jgi:nucleoside-diphosphate-sugar epimerase